MTGQKENVSEKITIKKYANRRLYNTATSSYVTLDHLAQMVKDGTQFAVFDAKSGDEITRSVLTQIIVEEENKGGQNLLPVSFLRHLISFYGDSLQGLVPSYLEQSMQAFATNQEQMRNYMKETMGGLNPFGGLEEMNKQNLALFENTMRMFTPQLYREDSDNPDGTPPAKEAAQPQSETDLEKMKEQLEAMQAQLSKLSQDK